MGPAGSSSKGSGGGGGSSGFGFGNDRSSGRSALDPSLMSLQSLAKVSKKSRLAIGKSFKGSGSAAAGSSSAPFGGLPRNDSNSSASSSRQGLAEALGIGLGSSSSSQYRQQQQQYGSSSGVPLQLQSAGGRSFRQPSAGSYSAKSETDLMTVSTNSSLSSAAPSPSVHSMLEGRGAEGGEGVASPPAAAAAAAAGEDAIRQLR
jgi:hypothetical protein